MAKKRKAWASTDRPKSERSAKAKPERMGRLSLAPLNVEDALRGFLAVPPPEPDAATVRKRTSIKKTSKNTEHIPKLPPKT